MTCVFVDHVGWSDESHWNTGRFRSLGLVSTPLEYIESMQSELLGLLRESGVGECKWSRLYGAAMRHLLAWWNREDFDDESGLSHLHHALTCLAMLTQYQFWYDDFDDRPRPRYKEEPPCVEDDQELKCEDPQEEETQSNGVSQEQAA